MNRGLVLQWAVFVLLVVGLVGGYVFIDAVDLLRLRSERISEQLVQITQGLADIEARIASTSGPTRAAAGAANEERRGHDAAVLLEERGQFANARYYDPLAVSGDRLIGAAISETKNLNTIVNNDSFVSSIWDSTYDSLCSRNFEKTEIFEPQMAESWSLSEDKLTYTIKLREGILWHDFVDPVSGEEWKDVPVTAEDFKFYIDVIKNPDVDCAPLRVYFQDLDRIEVVNDLEFRVVWSKKYFKSESITLGLSPLPRHFYHAYEGPFDGKRFNDDHERNRIVVGCGPYQFQRWDKFQRIVLERWEKYYGRRYGVMPPIKHRVIEIIKHPNTQFQALLAGKIDSMGLQPDQWVNKTNTPEFDPVTGSIRKIKTMGHAYFYIGYNLNNPLFQDRTVRRALTHLVNRERIASEVFFDLAVVTSGPFFIESPYYDSSVEPYPFSIEKGRELFADAGWRDTDGDGILDKDGKKFEFTILAVAGHPTQSKMLPIIKEDMEKAGVVMRIANVEWPVYTQRLETKSFEVCTLGWTSDLEPDPYQLWHSSQAEIPSSSNHIGFKNPEADRLIEEIRVCFDLQERIRLCHEFHRLLHEEQPYTFLFSRNSLLALSARYRNVREFPLGVEPKTFWTPTEAQKRIEF